MKAKFKRLISSLLFVSLLVSTFSVFSVSEVSATAESSDADLQSAVGAIVGSDHIEAKINVVGCTVAALQQEGFGPAAIAGVLGNFVGESGFSPFVWIGEGANGWKCYDAFKSGEKTFSYNNPDTEGGIGLAQWTFGRHKKLSDYCKNSGQPYITINNTYESDSGFDNTTYLCDSGTQLAYLIMEEKTDKIWEWRSGNANKHSDLNGQISFEEYKTIKDPKQAAVYWCACWEGNNVHAHDEVRLNAAEKFYAIVQKNYDFSSFIDETQASIVGEQLVGAGYWNESQLGAYCRVLELNVDDILAGATRDGLGFNEMEGLAAWERNIKYDNEDNGLIGWLRRIVMLVGIIFIIWVSFIYIAYWFDRINNLFYIDALGILTLGHLHISETEEECTFRVKNLGKEDRKTVNHRAILGICLVGIAFGVLIVSGLYYVALQKIVHLIQRLLRKVG